MSINVDGFCSLEIAKNIDLWYVLIALIFFLISVFIKGLTNYIIVNDKEKFPMHEAVSQNFIMQFFNGITPFATGGEPMAVYMLKEQGFFACLANCIVNAANNNNSIA